MNIICTICSDVLEQPDNICHTPCGHVFHMHCLTQWLERSQTCPQCRKEVIESRVQRLYFTFSNSEVDSGTVSSQGKIDGLKFQVLLKDKHIKHYTSKNITLEAQNVGLRREVRKVESELNRKNSAIYALREQAKYFEQQKLKCDKLKQRNAKLKDEIDKLQPLQTLLNGPLPEVDKMIRNSENPNELIIYIRVLKKELLATLEKCKQLRVSLKKIKEGCTQSQSADNFNLVSSETMQLREMIAISDSKNSYLEKRIKELEGILCISADNGSTSNQEKPPSKNNSLEESNDEATNTVESRRKKLSACSISNNQTKKKIHTYEATPVEINSSASQSDLNISTLSDESDNYTTNSSDCGIASKRSKLLECYAECDNTSNPYRKEHTKYTVSQMKSNLAALKRDNPGTFMEDIESDESATFVDLT